MRRVIIIIGIIGSSIGWSMDTAYSKHNSGSNAFHHNQFFLPKRVAFSLNDRYPHFDLIHSQKIFHRGRVSYSFLMQRRNSFLEVTMRENGRIINEKRFKRFPLRNHYCNSFCTFPSRSDRRYHQRFRNYGSPYHYGYRNNSVHSNRNNRNHTHWHGTYDHRQENGRVNHRHGQKKKWKQQESQYHNGRVIERSRSERRKG